jgi:hydroxymethylpyrimidine/phosphomethylpyrimidine kinase
MSEMPTRRSVLVFAGVDPSGGAGIAADLQSIVALGAHALTVVTALTVQDNDRAYEVQPVEPAFLLRQAQALLNKMEISAVKIGITGSAANARAIAGIIEQLRIEQPELPVVLDPVLASGHGDTLSRDDAVAALAPLLPLATLLTPNGPEAAALSGVPLDPAAGQAGPAGSAAQAKALLARGCKHVLITGGHADGPLVINHWFGRGADAVAGTGKGKQWRYPRLPGAFHGSGCTLASAAAALLAQRVPMARALELAQNHCSYALRDAYAIAGGQSIPRR